MRIKHHLTVLCVILLLITFAVYTFAFTRSHQTHAATAAAKGYGTAYGCPSNTVLSHTTTANVTITPRNANSIITVHNGDTIQFQFPFGQRWSGPTTSQGTLKLLPPAGYAARTSKVCVWRFVANGTGVTHLNFSGQALCNFGQVCPLYIVDVPFTVNVI